MRDIDRDIENLRDCHERLTIVSEQFSNAQFDLFSGAITITKYREISAALTAEYNFTMKEIKILNNAGVHSNPVYKDPGTDHAQYLGRVFYRGNLPANYHKIPVDDPRNRNVPG